MLNSGRSGWKKALPFLLPSLVGLIIFSFLPIIISLLLSVTSWTGMSRVNLTNGFFKFIHERFIGFENYVNILTDD